MASSSSSLDHWRSYFSTASSDIFSVIDHAIMVAASDCPKEFRLRRDRIAELLFTCKLSRCPGCNQVESQVLRGEEESGGGDDGARHCKREYNSNANHGSEFDFRTSRESKVASSNRESDVDNEEVNLKPHLVSNYSYGEAEALTDEMEEQSQAFNEVLRIKDVLLHSQDESESVLFGSLRSLQLMALNVDVLKSTEIGKVVNRLRKHRSLQIRNLARSLIDAWKDLVDEWYSAMDAIKNRNSQIGDDATPDSVNPSVMDEAEGLPSPPLDEEAFFAPETASIELSNIFDGMDDDGNLKNDEKCGNGGTLGRMACTENHKVTHRKPHATKEEETATATTTTTATTVTSAVDAGARMYQSDAIGDEVVGKPNKSSSVNGKPRRPLKLGEEPKASQVESSAAKPNKDGTQREGSSGPQCQNKFKSSDENSVQMKLEAAKKKLHERYLQVENAKRQRTIQMVELCDLPKQNLNPKSANRRPGNPNWHRGQGQRQFI